MRLATAKKVLENNGIWWSNYIELTNVERARAGNWVGCERILTAIQRVKLFLTQGK